ncbi:MAG: mechanosensitive ion channel family protein [Acidobacteriota bacterium]|nr:mechanosensitive ion channel family protein [Acidobacteriota bacterium]
MFMQNSNTASKVIENASLIPKVILDSVDALLTKFFERLPYFVAGIIVLIVFWLAGKIVRSIFLAASNRTKLDWRLRILFSRLIVISVFVLGIFTALTVIIPTFSFGDLIAGLGFTSFIVGFATKDILNNLLSGVLILWKQPFQIGDYIFVKDKQGKVEYIGVRATTLRMDDGELILMPNGDMYSNALVIRGASAERRMKLEISIGYDAKIDRAKASILKVLEATAGVVKEPNPSVFVTELAAAGVNLSIYFWIKTSENKPMEVFDGVATGIKNALNKAQIEIYPVNSNVVQNPIAENTAAEYQADSDKKEEF